MKKIFLIILLIILNNAQVQAQEKIFISVIIDNNPITNIDIINEAKYLAALNPKIQNLSKKKILAIAKESLIKEKIKENELSQFVKLGEKNDLLDKIIKDFYQKLNFNNLEEFENYLKKFDLSLNEVIKKIEIEAKWNELIYFKYNNQVEIDLEKLKKNISLEQSFQERELYFLSEILFLVKNESNYKEIYNKIKKSITENGFKNTANIYSSSDTAKFGGQIGWINKKNLNIQIIEKLETLEIGGITEAIKIPGGFLILKIEDKKKEKIEKKDYVKELNQLIQTEKNRKLTEFSLIYFNKVKIRTNIIYEP